MTQEGTSRTTVLITRATGTVGRHLVEKLRSTPGVEVRAASRRPEQLSRTSSWTTSSPTSRPDGAIRLPFGDSATSCIDAVDIPEPEHVDRGDEVEVRRRKWQPAAVGDAVVDSPRGIVTARPRGSSPRRGRARSPLRRESAQDLAQWIEVVGADVL
jgi:hypothetical protein